MRVHWSKECAGRGVRQRRDAGGGAARAGVTRRSSAARVIRPTASHRCYGTRNSKSRLRLGAFSGSRSRKPQAWRFITKPRFYPTFVPSDASSDRRAYGATARATGPTASPEALTGRPFVLPPAGGDGPHRHAADRALEVVALGAVEHHAGQAGADAVQVVERLLDQRPAAGRGRPRGRRRRPRRTPGSPRCCRGSGRCRSGSMSKCFFASSISRRSAPGESVLAW